MNSERTRFVRHGRGVRVTGKFPIYSGLSRPVRFLIAPLSRTLQGVRDECTHTRTVTRIKARGGLL